MALLFDFQTNTVSGRLHISPFEATGLIQGEGPQGVQVTMTIAETDLVAERVALPNGQIGRITLGIESTQPVAVSLSTRNETDGTTTPLIGQLSLNFTPDSKHLLGSVELHPTNLPSARSFVTDLTFTLNIELTAEQRAIVLLHQDAK